MGLRGDAPVSNTCTAQCPSLADTAPNPSSTCTPSCPAWPVGGWPPSTWGAAHYSCPDCLPPSWPLSPGCKDGPPISVHRGACGPPQPPLGRRAEPKRGGPRRGRAAQVGPEVGPPLFLFPGAQRSAGSAGLGPCRHLQPGAEVPRSGVVPELDGERFAGSGPGGGCPFRLAASWPPQRARRQRGGTAERRAQGAACAGPYGDAC